MLRQVIFTVWCSWKGRDKGGIARTGFTCLSSHFREAGQPLFTSFHYNGQWHHLLPPPFSVSKPCRQDSSQNLRSGFAACVALQPDAVTVFKCEWMQPLSHPFSSSFCRNPQEAFRKNRSHLKVLKTQFPLFFTWTVPFTTISGRMPLCDQQNREKTQKCGWNLSFIAMGISQALS